MTETMTTLSEDAKQEEPLPSEFYAMVVDSGPIIKQDVRNLMGKAQTYVTTPSVLREIRDSKARDHLEHAVLPLLDLQLREPSERAIQDVISFSKQTGDYAGLSTVDLQVLALTLDLEREGNRLSGKTSFDHIRTTPKRKIGLGSILPMNAKVNNSTSTSSSGSGSNNNKALQEEKTGEDDKGAQVPSEETPKLLGREDYDEVEESDDDGEESDNDESEVRVDGDNDDANANSKTNDEEGKVKEEQSNEGVNCGESQTDPPSADSPKSSSAELPPSSWNSKVSSTKESILNLTNKNDRLIQNAVPPKLSEMQSKMANNAADMRESLASKVSATKDSILKLAPQKNSDEESGNSEADAEKPAMPEKLSQMKLRMSKNTSQIKLRMSENTSHMKLLMSENTAKVRDSLVSTVSTTKESLLKMNQKKNADDDNYGTCKGDIEGFDDDQSGTKASTEKPSMPEKLSQMKLRVSENTANMRNSFASRVSATKQSLRNIKNKNNTDKGGNDDAKGEEDATKTDTDMLPTEDVAATISGGNDGEEDESSPTAATLPLPTPMEGTTQASNGTSNATQPMAAAAPVPADPKPPVAKSWAALVDPIAASKTSPLDPTLDLPFAKMSLKPTKDDDFGGQFDDASEDEGDDDEPQNDATTEMELQLDFPSLLAASIVPYEGEDDEIDAGAVNETVSGKGADNHGKHPEENPHHKTRASVFMTEEEKQQNLKPISKSGRTYNSFRKYKGLMKPKQPKKKSESVEEEKDEETLPMQSANGEVATNTEFTNPQASRFLSGGGGGETMLEEDDDGQGWITSSGDIQFMKNEGGGRLDPGKTGTIGGNNDATNAKKKSSGPPISQRTACATTDFAMQNVLLQMNLILLSTDGMRIRRLKSWVLRCGACFKIHGADDDFRDETNHHMKRLFCSHCGSDMMQRISASVDGKTGRLKLHFSKRKQGRHHSIRGTKFSLPKPGSGNKYKGELLMREDQLLSGAWNQKVKINSGRKYQTSKSQSMFGRDIASSVGCNVKSTSSATFGGKGWATSANTSSMGGFGTNADDIRVGFGARKNPNAAKGRERRGKKKKSTDRACGMRRY